MDTAEIIERNILSLITDEVRDFLYEGNVVSGEINERLLVFPFPIVELHKEEGKQYTVIWDKEDLYNQHYRDFMENYVMYMVVNYGPEDLVEAALKSFKNKYGVDYPRKKPSTEGS